ncbi:MAG: hypothetical protein JXA87_00125 [Thermoleophilia bacterium]|nr:hypothetical protein [Thermoleophilia bacterium]
MTGDPIIDWLLEGDPAIRWQVMRDLLRSDESEYVPERERVAAEGWGRLLLERQDPDGLWSRSLYNGKWTSTTYSLYLLKVLGLPPHHPQALLGCRRLLDSGLYEGREIRFSKNAKAPDLGVTALVLSVCAYFGLEDDSLFLIARHITDQQELDGNWLPNDSSGASDYTFETTLLVLEALVQSWGVAGGGPAGYASPAAVRKGRQFLLGHDLYLASGRPIKAGWASFSFPPYWFYDVLTVLDHLRSTGATPSPRMQKAVELVESRRGSDGTWKLGAKHQGRTFFDMEPAGRPSRWNTLRALRVLDWWRT